MTYPATDFGNVMSIYIRNKDIMHCLPLLASVLGDQYGVEVHIGGNQAATNGKEIFIPSLPLESDDTVLALVRGYIDHESGHIRYTDNKAVKDANMNAVTKFLWNAIEDWRIENRLGDIFPGCRQNLHWLIRHIFIKKRNDELEMAEKRFPAISILNYVLYTVRGWDIPEINTKRDEECKKLNYHFPSIAVQLDSILDKVRQYCPDTKTAIGYADELARCIKQFMPSNTNYSTTIKSERERNKCNNDETMHDNDIQTKIEINQNALEDLFNLDESNLPSSLGDVLAEELQSKAVGYMQNQVVVARAVERCRSHLTDEDKSKALRVCTGLRTRLQGLLQAQTIRKCQLGRKGRLCTPSLHRLSVGNPKVFLRDSEHLGLDTAVHILLDGSGSMSGEPMHLASLSCYAVAKALEMIPGVSVGATLFPAYASSIDVCPLVKHGEKVTDLFDITATGETPLAEALWWVLQTMLKMKEARKILIILTDGQPQRIHAVRQVLEMYRQMKIEVYGIGINASSVKRLLLDRSSIITSMEDLIPAMFGILQNALIGGKYDS